MRHVIPIAIFGQCGYRATIDGYETIHWTTQGAGTGSQCCPMPLCWLSASHADLARSRVTVEELFD